MSPLQAVENGRAVHRIDWTFGLNQLGTVLVYGLLTLFAIKTLSRNAEWKNTESLASSGLKVNPGNAKIYLTMGNVLARKVRLQMLLSRIQLRTDHTNVSFI